MSYIRGKVASVTLEKWLQSGRSQNIRMTEASSVPTSRHSTRPNQPFLYTSSFPLSTAHSHPVNRYIIHILSCLTENLGQMMAVLVRSVKSGRKRALIVGRAAAAAPGQHGNGGRP